MSDDNSFAKDFAKSRKWVGSSIEKKPTKKIGVINDPAFFAKRDAKNAITEDFSDAVMKSLLEKFDIFIFPVYECEGSWKDHPFLTKMPTDIFLTCKAHVMVMDYNSIGSTVEKFVKLLETGGTEFKLPKDSRLVSPLNIGKYITSGNVAFVGPDDHHILGIEVDRPPTFQVMAQTRARSKWP